ncbi:uncharacterized protein BT62DRAFT_207090 [Guyanagaster necrorhizus]|uniref:Uncharacterized protein n=1 Tax=Guyanagaster necrorhizus TaxID=856835 RepID=A0A9P7VQP7_9AGAR|nr:uncharacterized protein BT62DRAFT_207090 [Guyanagaster necrorhizus MCA 3950]KAG7445052.1 hypothetical protein BT62DRAFT_207090 [Guyanagaster necrorhizus MCA 3950]
MLQAASSQVPALAVLHVQKKAVLWFGFFNMLRHTAMGAVLPFWPVSCFQFFVAPGMEHNLAEFTRGPSGFMAVPVMPTTRTVYSSHLLDEHFGAISCLESITAMCYHNDSTGKNSA